MNKKLAFVILVACIVFQTNAQSFLNNDFKFEDGYYYNFKQLQQNTPELAWDNCEAVYYENRKDYKLVITELYHQDDSVGLKPIYAVVVDGRPYLKVHLDDKGITLAGLKVRGKICYLEFDEYFTEVSEIKAYNPLTGKPFRSQKVKNTQLKNAKMMFHFETGEMIEFNKPNFEQWIQSDKKLYKTVSAMSEAEAEEKLLKTLLIYVDRNPIKAPN